MHVAGVWCEPAALAGLQGAAGGALPATPWQCVELDGGTWIAAPEGDTALRWWWLATDVQLAHATVLAANLTRGDPGERRSAALATRVPWGTARNRAPLTTQTPHHALLRRQNLHQP